MSFIYKYVSNNDILYIGKTTNLKRRIIEHASEPKFQNIEYQIYYFRCVNNTEMDAYEYFLINKYHPKLNIALKNDNIHIQSLIEPEWKLYSYTPQLKKNKTETTIDIKQYENQEYLTIKEAAELKGVSTQAYYKRIKAGTVPMILINNKQCIPKTFVLEELAKETKVSIHKENINNSIQNNNIIYFLLDALEEQSKGAKNKYIQLIQRYFGVNINE